MQMSRHSKLSKATFRKGLAAITMLLGSVAHAEHAPSPEIQGFGRGTTGGLGGQTIKVTSLADSGPGSLRWALEEIDMPRVVTFDVSGMIPLRDEIEIQGDVTVDGHSAAEGITIAGARLRVVEDNVILRGLRVRPGDGDGMNKESRDGISIGTPKQKVSQVVIDGNSLTWGVDENLSIWGNVEDVTISNNIIAEALDNAGHDKGRHSMGFLIGGGEVSRVTVVGNLLAHNRHRNPSIKDDAREIEFVNNLAYNWGPNGLQADGVSLHVLGNAYIAGPNTVPREAIRLNANDTTGRYFMADNLAEITFPHLVQSRTVFRGSGVEVIPAAEVEAKVLATAGARHPDLDAIDKRILKTVINRTGRIIDSQDQVGGYVATQGRDAR